MELFAYTFDEWVSEVVLPIVRRGCLLLVHPCNAPALTVRPKITANHSGFQHNCFK